jgi:hypothetical protein
LIVRDQAKQRRLARAVRPDETDAITGCDPQVQIFDDALPAEMQRDVLEDDQAHGDGL